MQLVIPMLRSNHSERQISMATKSEYQPTGPLPVRWAVIRAFEPGEDHDTRGEAREEVIEIQSRLPQHGPPELSGLRSSKFRDRYRTMLVPTGVLVGMVKGGPVDEVAGFGWREAGDRTRPVIEPKPRGAGGAPAPKRNAKRHLDAARAEAERRQNEADRAGVL
jgi:hypothetical protein